MILKEPLPFVEALARNDLRELLPTSLNSAQIRELHRDITQRSFFSARTTLEEYLKQIQDEVHKIINPQVLPDRPGVLQGSDLATSRLALKQKLDALGYEPDPAKRGTIEDLSSDQRINLVVETNADVARGYGSFLQGQTEAVLDQWPAQELYRADDRTMPRDWETRWQEALDAAGDDNASKVYEDSGRMVARKDSGVWQALGDGSGGYDDTLGNPFPPFAFNSGMDVTDVERAEAESLGLIGPDEAVAPLDDRFGELTGTND